MRNVLNLIVLIATIVGFTSCSENYSNGERIGLITQFSRSGLMFKTYEGHLNLTQTGMNSSSAVPFDFSIDRDKEDQALIAKIDSAAQYGYKVKLTYHETFGWNWFNNRGETEHFILTCEILDKNPIQSAFNGTKSTTNSNVIHDTIYVVIVQKSKPVEIVKQTQTNQPNKVVVDPTYFSK